MRADGTSSSSPLLALVDHATRTWPRNVAVRGADGELTFEELSARAERLAQRLHQAGVMPGDLVGLCLDRSAALVVAALAVFKAHCAYLAIDPGYPDARVQWMLEDAGTSVVITNETSTPGSTGVGSIMLAAGGQLHDRSVPGHANPLYRPVHPTDLAYVVYTSGSTGRPKGVLVEHAGLSNLVGWHRARFALSAEDRCSQIASPGFDASVWEIWPCLASGASIHIVPEDLRVDPVGLRDWLVSESITVTFLPTAVAEGIITLSWPQDCALRYLLTGGDALSRRPSPGLRFTVVNNYGLSETTVVATSGVVAPGAEGLPSIGRPITGVVTEVVDERLQPVEPGAAGELVVGGVAVARGYINQDGLTAERFWDDRQVRKYRTGDLVRERPDGDLDFLGRLDDQLSIRGFRVEPGEVDSALSSHPAIQASVTIGVGHLADRQLVTYFITDGTEDPYPEELRQFLAEFLPDYMVPARLLRLDKLPLTPNGKIDRDALSAPVESAMDDADDERSLTVIEATILPVLAGLLGKAGIGVHQNFFLLGGHSMLGAQLIVRLEDLFGVELSLRYLFDHPTVAEIAAEVEGQVAGRGEASVSG